MNPRLERAVIIASVAAAVLGVLILAHAVLGGVPHGWDAIAYLFQAKIFASGALTAPATPYPKCFWVDNVVAHPDTGRRFAIYPPGWPILLAPFVLLGNPAIANALLSGLSVFLIWLLARRLLGVREARLAPVLALLSPFFMFMGASLFAHTSCATASLALTYALARSLDPAERHPRRWGTVAGAAFGLACLIRPLSGVLGGLCAAWISGWCVSLERRRWVRATLVAGIPAAAAGLVFLAYNAATTGSPFVLGYKLRAADMDLLGQMGTHREGIWTNLRINLPKFTGALNRETWGWPLSDLLPLAAGAVLCRRDRRMWAFAGAFVMFIIGESCYYYFDLAFGPRLVFEAFPWLVLGTALSLVSLWDRARELISSRALRGGIASLLLLQALYGASTLYGRLIRYYSAIYCGHGPELPRAIEERRIKNGIVFLSNKPEQAFIYGNLFLLNALDIGDGDVIYTRYVPAKLEPMIEAFPRDENWILDVEFDSLPGRNVYSDRYEVAKLRWHRLQGPLSEAP